jgi:hypothetical protein
MTYLIDTPRKTMTKHKVVLSKVGHLAHVQHKSPLYLPWLLIVCVSDDIVLMSHVYKFHSRIVVMSQIINKKFGAPTPSCFVYKHVNGQPYKNNFGLNKSACSRHKKDKQADKAGDLCE